MVPLYYVYWAAIAAMSLLQFLFGAFTVIGLMLTWRSTGFVQRHVWYVYLVPLMVVFWKFLTDGPMEPSADVLCIVYWTVQVSCIGLVIFPWVIDREPLVNVFFRQRQWGLRTRLLVLLIATAVGFGLSFLVVARLVAACHWSANR